MITLGLLILVLIVFISGNWVGYHAGYRDGYKAGVLADIQRHVQNNRKG